MMWFVGIWIFLLLIVRVHSPLVMRIFSIEVMKTLRLARRRNLVDVMRLQYMGCPPMLNRSTAFIKFILMWNEELGMSNLYFIFLLFWFEMQSYKKKLNVQNKPKNTKI